jgi:hypothetical protein
VSALDDFSKPTRETQFLVDGERVALREMLRDNAHDPEVCEWLRTARPGDRWPDMHSVNVRCVDGAS